ncbi:hypothetical protein H0H92_003024 [Tricholoma furcatifolium]|nr:hypothetical protein H0H92_003024 [Tricholoma furcatifolium]
MTLTQQHQVTRAAQRRLKQLEMENEQLIEDAEALKMTDEQRLILHRSFSSVKVEFSDLDGLTWQAQQPPLTVLTNTDHDTIRPRPHPRTSISSPNLSSPSTDTINALLHNHRTSSARSRSPIKGLFPSSSLDPYESDSERTIRGVQSHSDSKQKYPRLSKRSPVSVSARSVAKRLAKAVSPRKTVSSPAAAASHLHLVSSSSAPVLQLSNSNEPPRTTSYPAYITYSTPKPPPMPLSSHTHQNSHTHIPQPCSLCA